MTSYLEFDPATIGPTEPGHLGIAWSQMLARLAGGTYQVTSHPGAGTTVVIELPAL